MAFVLVFFRLFFSCDEVSEDMGFARGGLCSNTVVWTSFTLASVVLFESCFFRPFFEPHAFVGNCLV